MSKKKLKVEIIIEGVGVGVKNTGAEEDQEIEPGGHPLGLCGWDRFQCYGGDTDRQRPSPDNGQETPQEVHKVSLR